MSPGEDRPSADGAEEAGRPVEALAGLEIAPGPRFLGRIRGRIQRRVFGIQVLDFAWSGPSLVVMEYLKALIQYFRREGGEAGRKD